jgi:cation-transporting ATPase I
VQLLVELGADVVGLAVGLVLSVLPVGPPAVVSAAVPALSLARDIPRLRRRLDERLGRERAGLVLSLSLSLAQALAQRPVSSLVDLAFRAVRLRETLARRETWKERQGELCAAPSQTDPGSAGLPRRPVPLPKSPIEEYADRAWLLSLGGFVVSMFATRSVTRASAAIFCALPKPARLGRDVFVCELGHNLARRGLVVIDPDRLKLLDRVDCLVIQGDLIASSKFILGRIKFAADADEAACRRLVEELFDPAEPLAVRRSGSWELGPPALLQANLDLALEPIRRALARRGEIVVGLAHGDRVFALVEIRVVPQTGIEELVAAAHDIDMRVVASGVDEAALEGLQAEDVISPREGLYNGVRRLQREGRVVCLVASGHSPGWPVADVGIGLCRLGEPPPWGAHVMCRGNLSDVRFVLQACATARGVSKQSVNVALGAAAMGTVVSAGGLVPMTAQRAMLLVNAASLVAMVNGARASATLRRRELPPPRDPTPWHALDASGVLARLGSSPDGLAKKDVASRREALPRAPTPLAELAEAIGDELFNPFAPLLAAGAGLSALVGSTADAGVVAGVVVLNALVGGVQRFRAERAVRLLTAETRRRALVRRAGRLGEVAANRIVPGDVVSLGPGDSVPADCRLLEASSLQVDASSLTGESMPVSKDAAPSYEPQIADRRSMLYAGTSIAAGRGTAVVVAVGDKTEARRGAFAAKGDLAQGGVEKRLKHLMNLTGPVALAAGLGVVGAGLLRGRRLEDLVGSAVSLAVASVPEGLPLLATVAQLAAAERLSRRGVLVRNVRAIEALGRVDVICFDKTGTVTQGQIVLHAVSDGTETQQLESLESAGRRILAAALRATAEVSEPLVHPDPTDEALRGGARTTGTAATDYCPGWERLRELPFEAGRSYHAVVAKSAGGLRLGVKGAAEVILPACTSWARLGRVEPLDAATSGFLAAEAARLGLEGLRILAVAEALATGDAEPDPTHLADLAFHGFLAFTDPVRPAAAAAVAGLRRAGIAVLMLTGDHQSTAAAIAKELKLCDRCEILTGGEIATLTNEELEARLADACVLARTTPSQKVRVIRALQRMGRIVAMAGDGANDAPAIRLANVGIAMGERSTAAARGAADVILTDERIEAIVDAVSEGRAMWASVRDAVSILVGGNLGEIGFTLLAGLVDGRPPLNSRQLLLVNLMTDAAPAMAIALRPPNRQTLDALALEGPEASLGRPLDIDIVKRAAVTALGAGAAWTVGRLLGSAERATTIGLISVVATQLGQTLVAGSTNLPVLLTGLGSTAALAAIVQTPVVSRFFGCTPLGPLAWSIALGCAAATTYASVSVPRVFEHLAARVHRHLPGDDGASPDALAGDADGADAPPDGI